MSDIYSTSLCLHNKDLAWINRIPFIEGAIINNVCELLISNIFLYYLLQKLH